LPWAGWKELARSLLIVERELRIRGIRNEIPEKGRHDTGLPLDSF